MAPLNKLSKREWEVADLLLQGKSNKLIALSLSISERTVEFHLKNIYAKFQVSSRIELILKLRNATGEVENQKLGISTVDGIRKSIENNGRLNFWMELASSLMHETIFMINQELEMKKLLSLNNLLILAASLLLLFVNWLAFHDFREDHSVRDWLMLIASIMVILKFTRELWNQTLEKVPN